MPSVKLLRYCHCLVCKRRNDVRCIDWYGYFIRDVLRLVNLWLRLCYNRLGFRLLLGDHDSRLYLSHWLRFDYFATSVIFCIC